MKLQKLEELFEEQLRDIFSAEQQILKALPKMIKTVSTPALKEALSGHLQETQEQVTRLEQIGKKFDLKLTGMKCKAMEGLINEGKEALELDGDPMLIDLAIIASAQRVEHYEISAYGTAREMAEQLGYDQAAKLLQETLEEETGADEKLTEVSGSEIFPALGQPKENKKSEYGLRL